MAAKALAIFAVILLFGFCIYIGMLPVVDWVQRFDDWINGRATMRLLVTDPPEYSSDVLSIKITFSKIEIHRFPLAGDGTGESWITLTSEPITIDLIQILNITQLIGEFKIQPGNYTEIRLVVSTAQVSIQTQILIMNITLQIPSANQTGFKLHFARPLIVEAGDLATVTVDIRVDDTALHNGLLTPSMTTKTE